MKIIILSFIFLFATYFSVSAQQAGCADKGKTKTETKSETKSKTGIQIFKGQITELEFYKQCFTLN